MQDPNKRETFWNLVSRILYDRWKEFNLNNEILSIYD